jgi:glycosyltransferase involved in cell wall biosynthesis
MKEPLRVALLNHSGQLGGGEWSMLRLASHLDPDSVRVTVLAGAEGPFVERLRAEGIRTVVLPYGEIGDLRKERFDLLGLAAPRLHALAARLVRERIAFFRRERIQIVHTNSLKSHAVGGLAGRLARKRVLWHVRDHLEPPYLPAAAARAIQAAARLVPHHVVAVSHSAARVLGRADVTVLHQSVPLPPPNEHRRVNGTLRIGLVGRIAPWKGQDVFLDAAAHLAARNPHVEWVLAGSALFGEQEFERRLRHRAEAPDLHGRVRFLGFCDDVWSVYRDLDVAVHASTLAEPYGNVILEAMASRRPIVAAAAGGPLELVDHGRTGLLVEPGDPAALASALERLIGDVDERRRLADAGRKHVERTGSLEDDARRVEEIYRRLAA